MGAASVIKYLLFFFNLLICTGGVVLLGLGILLNIQLSKQTDGPWNILSIVFIALGAIIFFVAFLGCCGAIRESTCMLNTFGAFLLFVFLIQVAGAVLIFVYEERFVDGFRKTLEKTIGSYYEKDEAAKEIWDGFQKNLECCGIDEPADWRKYYSGNQPLPESCSCKNSVGSTCTTIGSQKIYSEGCYKKLIYAVKTYSTIVAAVAIAIALVELIGAIFSFRLASTVRKREHGFY